jgi:Zn finger protein HypA/HybF involved in hydrogenase expression
MHELGLIDPLLRRLEAVATAEGAGRVCGVRIWLGALSQCSPAHFAEHFAAAACGTIAEGARLEFTVSDDPADADAGHVRIESVELAT